MRLSIDETPIDVYTEASITSGSRVQIQNLSPHYISVFSGGSAPASLDEYFKMAPREWLEFEGVVLMVQSSLFPGVIVVQAIT